MEPLARIQRVEICKGAGLHDPLRAGNTLRVEIVDANDAAIWRQVEITFNGVGSLFPRKFEGGQGVFRRIVRGPAVSNEEWFRWQGGGDHKESEG